MELIRLQAPSSCSEPSSSPGVSLSPWTVCCGRTDAGGWEEALLSLATFGPVGRLAQAFQTLGSMQAHLQEDAERLDKQRLAGWTPVSTPTNAMKEPWHACSRR